jgi:hypothetical protein
MMKRKPTHESGMAGEYRLGYEPALTLGNAKAIDILAEHKETGDTIRISVKAIRGGGKWGVGSEDLSRKENLFFVFLHYQDFTNVNTRPEVFVIPSSDVEKLKQRWFNSFAVYCSNKEEQKKLGDYKDAWPLLEKGYGLYNNS